MNKCWGWVGHRRLTQRLPHLIQVCGPGCHSTPPGPHRPAAYPELFVVHAAWHITLKYLVVHGKLPGYREHIHTWTQQSCCCLSSQCEECSGLLCSSERSIRTLAACQVSHERGLSCKHVLGNVHMQKGRSARGFPHNALSCRSVSLDHGLWRGNAAGKY